MHEHLHATGLQVRCNQGAGVLSGCLGSLVGVWDVGWVFGEFGGCLGS